VLVVPTRPSLFQTRTVMELRWCPFQLFGFTAIHLNRGVGAAGRPEIPLPDAVAGGDGLQLAAQGLGIEPLWR